MSSTSSDDFGEINFNDTTDISSYSTSEDTETEETHSEEISIISSSLSLPFEDTTFESSENEAQIEELSNDDDNVDDSSEAHDEGSSDDVIYISNDEIDDVDMYEYEVSESEASYYVGEEILSVSSLHPQNETEEHYNEDIEESPDVLTPFIPPDEDTGRGEDIMLKCPVCYKTNVSIINRCGHVLCSSCRPHLTRCPVCRAGFKNERRIYPT